MAARITLYDGVTALEIRVGTTAPPEVVSQAEQLRDDLNAFVAAADPFSVVVTDTTADGHIRVETETAWVPGDPDWSLLTSADGVLSVRARSAEWLTRAVARVSWALGKRMWLPNAAFLIQPLLETIEVRLNVRKVHDVQDTGAYGTSGDFQFGDLERTFPEWQRINMIAPVSSVTSSHLWQRATAELGPAGTAEWVSPDDFIEAGKRLQVYRQDDHGNYIVADRFAEWLKTEFPDATSFSVSTTDGIRGWEDVLGFGRDDGDPMTYNETEINVFLAKKVCANFAADPDLSSPQISMLAYGSTSYPADPLKTDPDGDPIRLPDDLHVVVTKGFFQGSEDWNSVHDSYRAISDNPDQQYSGYWYMDVWTGNRDRPGAAPISRESVVSDWWNNDVPRVTDNYPLYVGGELGSGLCPTFLGALIWQSAWRRRSEDLSRLASKLVRKFRRTCFPTRAVRTPMREFTESVLWIQEGSFAPLLTEDLLHRMYTLLLTAIDASPSVEERMRINAFVKYIRFLELYRAVLAAEVETASGLDVYDEFRAFLYNIRYEGLVNYRFWTSIDPFGADADLSGRHDENVLTYISLQNFPCRAPASWLDGGALFPDFSDDGIRTICVEGIANNDVYPFTTIGYPDDPFDGLEHPTTPDAAAAPTNRASSQSWFDRSDAVTLWLRTKSDQTSIDWWLRPWVSGVGQGASQTVELVDRFQEVAGSRTFTTADPREWTNWVVTDLEAGAVYQVRVRDPRKEGMLFCWWLDGDPGTATDDDPDNDPNDISGTYLVSFRILPAETQTILGGSPQWYFHVPSGATELGGVWSKREGEIWDAAGTTILDKDTQNLDSSLQPFQHALDVSQTDTIMRGANAGGDLTLMTIPPYLALHPDELIVPVSVSGGVATRGR